MYQSDLRAVFCIMSENPDSWDYDGRWIWAVAVKSVNMLFHYGIQYEGIFSETDALFRMLQTKVMDIGFWIRDTSGFVERQRQEFNSFYERFEQKCATLWTTDSVWSQMSVRDERKRMFCYILDNISVQLVARFVFPWCGRLYNILWHVTTFWLNQTAETVQICQVLWLC